MAEPRLVDSDVTEPTTIEHKCEEMFVGGALEQKYNYIVYHFDANGAYIWARTYVEEIKTVSVHGPFESRTTRELIQGPLDPAVLSYLKRRFKTIKALRSEGYVTIWSGD